jgi:hypothetical protein
MIIKYLINIFGIIRCSIYTTAVLGGVPADYEELWRNSTLDLQADRDAKEVIGAHLCAAISVAIDLVNESKKTNGTEEIHKLFDKEKMCIQSTTLTDKKLERPTPDKVFRKAERDGISVLIPASNAVGIVLQHSLSKKPTLYELEELLKNKV